MLLDAPARLRLLSQLQRRLRERLAPRLQALFDELDLKLFDLAERSHAGAQQHLYYAGLRECRRLRGEVERDFLDALVAVLRPTDGAVPGTGSAPLRLLAPEELEESLALSVPAARLAEQLALPVEALDRRLASLLDQARDNGAPRLGPQAIAHAFRDAFQRLDVGLEVRLVTHALFARHVLEVLDPLYAELNRELVAAGVLPALPSPGARHAAIPPRSVPAREAEADPTPALLRELLARLAPRPVGAAASNSPGLPREQLLRALDHVRADENEPTRLKADLLAASRGLGGHTEATFGRSEESLIDLVGLLFQAVRHDPHLPGPLQPVLARLQRPFLKLALSDPDLLQAPRHPGRHLVDEVGEAAVGWTPTVDPDGHWLQALNSLVDTLLQDRGDARIAFERAAQAWQEQQEAPRRRAKLAEQRAVETALGRERLRIARYRVAVLLERRLPRHSLLPWIRQLVRGPWANYLVLAWLRQGEGGETFRAAMGFVDELLWCDEHGATSGDAARLRAAPERLDRLLRQGLEAVAWHDREIERLARELRGFLVALRRRRPAPDFMFEIDPRLNTADFAVTWAEHELEEQPGGDALDAALLAQIRALPPGTWFELGARQCERARLSWTSPFSGRCLLVNRNGLRVDEVTPERLADEIERGLTRVLEDTRLLQRAVQQLLAQLREGDAGQRLA